MHDGHDDRVHSTPRFLCLAFPVLSSVAQEHRRVRPLERLSGILLPHEQRPVPKLRYAVGAVTVCVLDALKCACVSPFRCACCARAVLLLFLPPMPHPHGAGGDAVQNVLHCWRDDTILKSYNVSVVF